jgi:endoglucanase
VFVIRVRTMVTVFALLISALLLPGAARAATPTASLAASWTGPLSTSGRYVVDASGSRWTSLRISWHRW